MAQVPQTNPNNPNDLPTLDPIGAEETDDGNDGNVEPELEIATGSESDSALGDEVSRYTASLTSSIEKFITENGRRYHSHRDEAYIMPNDDSELDRLDLMHQLLRIVMKEKLHLAPIDKDRPVRILDIGAGTGIWAVEMGDQYPLSEILGTDLSPTQSTWVPPNVKFEIDDCEEEWTFAQPFDYIHSRYMIGSIRNWPRLVGQSYTHLVPGGWVEYHDFDARYYSEDGSLVKGSPIDSWVTTWMQASNDAGRDPQPGPKLFGWLQEAGFINVKQERYRIPIGPWPKDSQLKMTGAWNLVQLEDGLEGVTLRLYTQFLGWTTEEIQVLLAKVRKDLQNPRIHVMYDLYVVYGQKPYDSSGPSQTQDDI